VYLLYSSYPLSIGGAPGRALNQQGVVEQQKQKGVNTQLIPLPLQIAFGPAFVNLAPHRRS
jgi:hypothetical protein